MSEFYVAFYYDYGWTVCRKVDSGIHIMIRSYNPMDMGRFVMEEAKEALELVEKEFLDTMTLKHAETPVEYLARNYDGKIPLNELRPEVLDALIDRYPSAEQFVIYALEHHLLATTDSSETVWVSIYGASQTKETYLKWKTQNWALLKTSILKEDSSFETLPTIPVGVTS